MTAPRTATSGDPMLALRGRLAAVKAANAGRFSDEGMAAQHAVELEVLAIRPTTAAGAVAALEWAMEEIVDDDPAAAHDNQIALALIAGAAGVLRSRVPRSSSRFAAIAAGRVAVDAARARARQRAAWASRRRWRRRFARLGRAIGLVAPRPAREVPDFLYGLGAIGRHLGIGRNQVRTLVVRGAIPAFDLDGATCARRSSLARRFAELEAASTET